MKDKNGIAELQAEIGLYRDGEFSEVEILKRELRFTDKELNLIRNAFQEQIWEYKDGWSAVKKIIAKCDELLKERKD